MDGKYTLIGQTAVPCDDLLEWAKWYESSDRTVFQNVVGEWFVSTVFLALDHRFGLGAPLLFETMIFLRAARRRPHEGADAWLTRTEPLRAESDQTLIEWQERYSDWADAEAGHKRAVLAVEERTRTASGTV